MRVQAIRFWHGVRSELLQLPIGTVAHYTKAGAPHPRDAGARLSMGWPVGQITDYRFDPEHDCSGMHVHELVTHWAVHIDRVHPACDLIEHVRRDKPDSLYWGGAVVGGLVGAALGGKRDSALAGAAFGLLAAAVIHGGSKTPSG